MVAWSGYVDKRRLARHAIGGAQRASFAGVVRTLLLLLLAGCVRASTASNGREGKPCPIKPFACGAISLGPLDSNRDPRKTYLQRYIKNKCGCMLSNYRVSSTVWIRFASRLRDEDSHFVACPNLVVTAAMAERSPLRACVKRASLCPHAKPVALLAIEI